jgi:hypothetical protein
MRLVQLRSGPDNQCAALVEGGKLRILRETLSITALAWIAIVGKTSIANVIKSLAKAERTMLDYDAVYSGTHEMKIGVPVKAAMVSGTGLTHLGSAKDRQSMHSSPAEQLTDSMKMFRWGVEGGKPDAGKIGMSPEWFYKGDGSILRAHNEPLDIPSHAEDGGEEAEIAGIYMIGPDGTPHRIGMAIGNEFSDHKFEERNYLNLAGSKLRTCSIGPEIVIDPEFKSVPGQVTIERNGKTLWTKSILTGEDEMCHSLANIEHHHFKFEAHRKPGDVHVHFYGACALSFGDGIELLDGDIMQIAFEGFGRPLRNPVRKASTADALVSVKSLA